MKIVPFHVKHLQELQLQPAQMWMQPMVNEFEYAQALERADSYAALVGDRVVAVAGIVTVWPGRAHLSALLSADLADGNQFLMLHRETLRRVEALPHRRVEATVDDRFEEGHRWLAMLGFHLETPMGMSGYMPDGRTSFLYARVNP